MNKHSILALVCLAILTTTTAAHARNYESINFNPSEVQPMSISETTAWISEYAPEIMRDLDEIRTIDPRLHEDIMMFATEEIAFAEEIREFDPEALADFLKTARMEVHSELLALKYRNAKDAKTKKQFKQELQELTVDIFDARMDEHNTMITEIEEELKELKRTGEVRAKNRDKIIERRMNELTTADSEDLEWW